ncbi:hypothetical protein FHR25_004925 [Yokenella regensburgei]|nr:hypothetical protein FHR25_004925 [Yokenella regensburgei]
MQIHLQSTFRQSLKISRVQRIDAPAIFWRFRDINATGQLFSVQIDNKLSVRRVTVRIGDVWFTEIPDELVATILQLTKKFLLVHFCSLPSFLKNSSRPQPFAPLPPEC